MPNVTMSDIQIMFIDYYKRAIDIELGRRVAGIWDVARWYECGEPYISRGQDRICHKYKGHPGRHAQYASTKS